MYEMMTLKHAFNAKDMNSLVYKILRGKVGGLYNIGKYSVTTLFSVLMFCKTFLNTILDPLHLKDQV